MVEARGGVFVPTMGALHDGHMSLVKIAKRLAGVRGLPTVVSIFVNPTQFGPGEDYSRYPRTLESDLALCEQAGVDVVFVPDVGTVYPEDGHPPAIMLPRCATAPALEDRLRPGHFAGVIQVVSRLFDLVMPAAAVFGEKDWQQLQVIRAMVRESGRAIDLVPGPTVREADGLAMSSRNRFLTDTQRKQGLALSRGLATAAAATSKAAAEHLLRAALDEARLLIDYAVVRDEETLEDVCPFRPCRALVAARFSRDEPLRLIDNGPAGPFSA